ncbi:hypothetical protein [Dactylosporangium cerinum]
MAAEGVDRAVHAVAGEGYIGTCRAIWPAVVSGQRSASTGLSQATAAPRATTASRSATVSKSRVMTNEPRSAPASLITTTAEPPVTASRRSATGHGVSIAGSR